MEKSYLIKRKSLLLAGIKEEADVSNILAFDNMAIELGKSETDPSNVILQTKDSIKETIDNSILTAHKQIVGEVEASTDAEAKQVIQDYNDGKDITFKSTFEADGSYTYNKHKAIKGDIVFFIKRNAGDVFKPEEAVILSDLSMDLLSSTNADDLRLANVESHDKDQDSKILALQDQSDNHDVKIENDRDVIGYGAIAQATALTEGSKLVLRSEVKSAVDNLGQRADNNGTNIITLFQEHTEDKKAIDANTAQLAINTPAVVSNTAEIVINKDKLTKNTSDIAQNVIDIADNKAGITKNATGITAEEAATDLIKTRLDALEAIGNAGKKVFDTGAQRSDGQYAPKKNMVVFGGDLTGGTLDLTTIPATSMDGGVAFEAKDFALNTNTPPEGPEVQVVVYGDESDPVTTEDSLDADWTGTQSFGTMRAGKLHGDDLSTGHWSANVTVDNNGLVTIKNVAIQNDPKTGNPYPVKRFILVQTTLDLSEALIGAQPYYSKTESDTKFTTKTETAALDARVVTNTSGIAANRATGSTNSGGIATNSAAIALNTTGVATNKSGIAVEHSKNASQDTAIAKNTTDVALKQDKNDTALTTTSHSVVGAINEVATKVNTNTTVIAQLGAKKVTGGNLLSTAETLATEKFVTDSYDTKTDVDAKIATSLTHADTAAKALFSDSLTLVYDDGTTEVVKVGK